MTINSSIAMIEALAEELGPLLERVVFLGGASIPLLITDPGAPPFRTTIDVDMAVSARTYAEYDRFQQELRRRGFTHDSEGPVCRFRKGPLVADFMPPTGVLGFTNRWYEAALQDPDEVTLPNGNRVRVASAPVLLATKLEALRGRSGGDYRSSHDLEDIVSLVDGREELLGEIHSAPDELCRYLAEAFASLLAVSSIEEIVAGHLPSDNISQGRVRPLLLKFESIAQG